MHLVTQFRRTVLAVLIAIGPMLTICGGTASAQSSQRPNIVMLMTDDTGWNDFGAYSNGGLTLGHPTPNLVKMA